MKQVFIVLFCLCLSSCQYQPERAAVNKVIEEARPSPFNANGVVEKADAELPAADPGKENAMVIELFMDGKISLKSSQKSDKTENMGSVKDTRKLSSRVGELLAAREDKTVFIKSPRSLRYGDVVAVIDEVKAAGGAPIGLQIKD